MPKKIINLIKMNLLYKELRVLNYWELFIFFIRKIVFISVSRNPKTIIKIQSASLV